MPAAKILPCGYVRTGRLKDHLAHYRSCSDPFCKDRLAMWEAMVVAFREEQLARVAAKAAHIKAEQKVKGVLNAQANQQ